MSKHMETGIPPVYKFVPPAFMLSAIKSQRVQSIDLLRGIVMIIMALDHVRDYFHRDAFLYSPGDLTQTNVFLFFTRFITHYCAPVFVLLAGVSAYLYGSTRTRHELARYLFTRGLWLVFAELFIMSLGRTFNPAYPYFTLQVIWAIGICMMVLAAMIYMNRKIILAMGILLMVTHNLLDTIHVPGNFLWSFLHETSDFTVGRFTFTVLYPVMPWIGIIATGYCLGGLYGPGYDPKKRSITLIVIGTAAIAVFILLRSVNFYGDPAHWSAQKTTIFSVLSFLNLTKYPPSLLYILITLGPALVWLGLTEKPLNALTARIAVFGRVPFFYYVIHIYLIHLLAVIGALICGYDGSLMILSYRINSTPGLKGYGFDLLTVYLVWVGVILLLYPCCRWFDRYKRAHQSTHKWLSYL